MRTLTATNPESGMTTYTYDPDSNVLTKTDARGITTTYAYDALNRVTGKTYSDATYPVSYSYDVSSGPSPLNTIGRWPIQAWVWLEWEKQFPMD